MWTKFNKLLAPFRVRSCYETFSLVATNTLVLFAILNLGIGVFYSLRDRNYHQPEKLQHVNLRAYQNVPKTKVRQLLNDYLSFEQQGTVFRPYTQVGDPLFKSKTVNIVRDSFGFEFRKSTQPLVGVGRSKKIFIFGGSTTFGSHLADDWTIPSYLQTILNKRSNRFHYEVSNFGTRGHSWFQELVHFQRLLHAGHRPDVAIFVDGIEFGKNHWSKNIPHWTQDAALLWEKYQQGMFQNPFPTAFPLFRLMNEIRTNEMDKARDHLMTTRYPHLVAPTINEKEVKALRTSYIRITKQRRAIAEAYGVTPYFLWQPHAGYRCKNTEALPANYLKNIKQIYDHMRWTKIDDFHNLYKLCGKRENLFVDAIHYGPELNQLIAEKIDEILS